MNGFMDNYQDDKVYNILILDSNSIKLINICQC